MGAAPAKFSRDLAFLNAQNASALNNDGYSRSYSRHWVNRVL